MYNLFMQRSKGFSAIALVLVLCLMALGGLLFVAYRQSPDSIEDTDLSTELAPDEPNNTNVKENTEPDSDSDKPPEEKLVCAKYGYDGCNAFKDLKRTNPNGKPGEYHLIGKVSHYDPAVPKDKLRFRKIDTLLLFSNLINCDIIEAGVWGATSTDYSSISLDSDSESIILSADTSHTGSCDYEGCIPESGTQTYKFKVDKNTGELFILVQ